MGDGSGGGGSSSSNPSIVAVQMARDGVVIVSRTRDPSFQLSGPGKVASLALYGWMYAVYAPSKKAPAGGQRNQGKAAVAEGNHERSPSRGSPQPVIGQYTTTRILSPALQ